MSDLPTEHC